MARKGGSFIDKRRPSTGWGRARADYPGKFVFHCHILFHEDHGMMAVVEVTE